MIGHFHSIQIQLLEMYLYSHLEPKLWRNRIIFFFYWFLLPSPVETTFHSLGFETVGGLQWVFRVEIHRHTHPVCICALAWICSQRQKTCVLSVSLGSAHLLLLLIHIFIPIFFLSLIMPCSANMKSATLIGNCFLCRFRSSLPLWELPENNNRTEQ